MQFDIRMGIPEMEEHWNDLCAREAGNDLDRHEKELFKRLLKAFRLLSLNPRHPGLNSHEIEPLSRKVGLKVFESYLENNTPAAGRIFWVYGPGKGEITIVGCEPHPEDRKKHGYNKVSLSDLPPLQ